jgi:hypothetical protein
LNTFFAGIVSESCKGLVQYFGHGSSDMLIGILSSAIAGGVTGAVWSLRQDHDLPQVLVSYPLGGLLAVAAFVLICSLRSDPPDAPAPFAARD